MVTTNEQRLAERLKLFRSHGIVRDPAAFRVRPSEPEPWAYEMQALGFNYRLPDVLCALGLSQLAKLGRFAAKRRALAARYQAILRPLAPMVRAVAPPRGCDPALHLFIVLIDFAAAGLTRAALMAALAGRGVGSQVHYIPVHRQPYYRDRYGDLDLPGADAYYASCLSLPLYPGMAESDPDRVVEALAEALGLSA